MFDWRPELQCVHTHVFLFVKVEWKDPDYEKNSELISTENKLKLICGGLFLMVFIHFKLFWISSKLSHEHKTGINNSNAQHVILQRKWFLELPEFFISKLWKGIEKVEQKMLCIYFPRSARTKLHWDNHCRCYKLSKHSEEQNFAFRYLIRTFQNEILYQLKLAELLKLFYWNWWMH